MLHHKSPVAFLDAPGNHIAADITAVDKVILIASVPPGNHGFSDIAADAHRPLDRVNLSQICGHVAPVNMVNHILQIVVSGGMKLRLPVINELERDIGMGKSETLHQFAHIACFRHGGLQKFPPCRRIVEKTAHQKGRPVRSSHLLQLSLRSAFNHIADAHIGVRCLGNQFYHGNRRDTGQRLAPEPQGRHMKQILHCPDFAGGMTQKGYSHLILFNAASIVRNTNQGSTPVPNLYGDGCGARVYGIFHKLLDHGGRPLNDLARRDLIYGLLIQHLYSAHPITTCSLSCSAAGRWYSELPAASCSPDPYPGFL